MSEARSCRPGAALYWNDRSDFPLDWNGPIDRPFDAFPDESKAQPIVELLEGVVRRFPERIALAGPHVIPSALRAVALSALSASAAYRPGTYSGELTIFEPDRCDLGVPLTALLWSRHASALRCEKLRGRHDDMLVGTNAQAVADLLTRCLESAA
jgi:hypothetical protein